MKKLLSLSADEVPDFRNKTKGTIIFKYQK